MKLISYRVLWLILCLWPGIAGAHIIIGSWNLQQLGSRKQDSAYGIMADCIRGFDLVALQEVRTGEKGNRAVARLVALLNTRGQQWDYCISQPTSAPQEHAGESERYVFLWKKAKVQLVGEAVLAKSFAGAISREPFVGVFRAEGKLLTLVNFHALPKKKQPEREIKYLKYFPDSLRLENVIFLGDFNCPESHTVFNPLKNKGYRPALQGQRTTLKQECRSGNCLASELDNIFYPGAVFRKSRAGIAPFYRRFKGDMRAARRLSDHVPIYVVLHLN